MFSPHRVTDRGERVGLKGFISRTSWSKMAPSEWVWYHQQCSWTCSILLKICAAAHYMSQSSDYDCMASSPPYNEGKSPLNRSVLVWWPYSTSGRRQNPHTAVEFISWCLPPYGRCRCLHTLISKQNSHWKPDLLLDWWTAVIRLRCNDKAFCWRDWFFFRSTPHLLPFPSDDPPLSRWAIGSQLSLVFVSAEKNQIATVNSDNEQCSLEW